MLHMLRRSILSVSKLYSTSASALPKIIPKAQADALLEQCILVDENDKSVGADSKRNCHFVESLTLHRAFSVFLFNENGEMLLQKRSLDKVTFPDCYTNACCSHPLFDIEGEKVEEGALGIRRAAQRRLTHELGIPAEQVPPESFRYLTRILYRDVGDGKWGEHEVDYILFLQKNVTIKPNPEEISEVLYVPRNNMNSIISNLKAPLTPWFKLILKHHLPLWWDNLHCLEKFEDHKTIHKFN